MCDLHLSAGERGLPQKGRFSPWAAPPRVGGHVLHSSFWDPVGCVWGGPLPHPSEAEVRQTPPTLGTSTQPQAQHIHSLLSPGCLPLLCWPETISGGEQSHKLLPKAKEAGDGWSGVSLPVHIPASLAGRLSVGGLKGPHSPECALPAEA